MKDVNICHGSKYKNDAKKYNAYVDEVATTKSLNAAFWKNNATVICVCES